MIEDILRFLVLFEVGCLLSMLIGFLSHFINREEGKLKKKRG